MITKKITKDNLLKKVEELETKLWEAEQTIEAIKYDKIDAFVISTNKGEQIFTLEGADRPYRIFLEQMNEGAVTLSNDGIILFCNKGFADIFKFPMESIIGTKLIELADPQEHKRLDSFIRHNNGSAKEEINFLRADKSVVSIYLSLTELSIEELEPVLCLIATDLTEKKKSEEIIAAEKLARSILEQSGEAIVVCDEKMRIVRANKAAELLAGTSVLFKPFDSVFPLYKNKTRIHVQKLTDSINKEMPEVALINVNKEKLHLILNIGQLIGQQNQVLGYVINLTNITKHISAEEKLNASLREKTVLLKEIHHRVKNNLQIISSLLALQSAQIKEESLLGILNECRSRISSMALIHQKLYESRSFSSISIPDYLKELMVSLNSTYQLQNCEVKLDLPEDDVLLTIDAAIPLGLIMNELVTNSLKHAFIECDKGEIKLSLREKDESKIQIFLEDNGSGIPQDVDFYNPETLGLQLVQTLVKQLGGEIELVNTEGTKIRIEIPKEQQ